MVSLPAAAGAWVLPQPAPAGIALSRRSGAGWADAFVVHHILFPLAPGRRVTALPRVPMTSPPGLCQGLVQVAPAPQLRVRASTSTA